MYNNRRIHNVQEKLPQPRDGELYKVQPSCHARLLRKEHVLLIIIERGPEQQCEIVSREDGVVENVIDRNAGAGTFALDEIDLWRERCYATHHE